VDHHRRRLLLRKYRWSSCLCAGPPCQRSNDFVALWANEKSERVLWSDKIYLVPANDGRILAGATVEYVGLRQERNRRGVEKY